MYHLHHIYRGFVIIKDGDFWYSYSESGETNFTDLAETLAGAKAAIDDYYDKTSWYWD